jgi:homoserine O-acetyltransferase
MQVARKYETFAARATGIGVSGDAAAVQIFRSDEALLLESGASLPSIEIAYTLSGVFNPLESNVVWVFHALTANCDPAAWWPTLVGPGKLLDPARYFIVCANIVGSCYGSTGPNCIDPRTGRRYGLDFPLLTVRDMVQAHERLRVHLGLERIHLGIGGSLGGQQLLEWAVTAPHLFDNVCLIATNARHSAWGIAFNEAQRMALAADPTFRDNAVGAGRKGLQAARATAMLSYRNQHAYCRTQTDVEDKLDCFRASTYQVYQGEKLADRFCAHCYATLTRAMDSHNIGRGRGPIAEVLASIRARTLVVGILSDILFPWHEQKLIADHIACGTLRLIDSLYGHDGFLVEGAGIAEHLGKFLGDSSHCEETT